LFFQVLKFLRQLILPQYRVNLPLLLHEPYIYVTTCVSSGALDMLQTYVGLTSIIALLQLAVTPSKTNLMLKLTSETNPIKTLTRKNPVCALNSHVNAFFLKIPITIFISTANHSFYTFNYSKINMPPNVISRCLGGKLKASAVADGLALEQFEAE